ncbi:MAG: hypothetical protein FWE04_06575 [Oscillospiraceae bacterium]|nr:hypothetical protein [Oscillospiraceae bacterium]
MMIRTDIITATMIIITSVNVSANEMIDTGMKMIGVTVIHLDINLIKTS